MQFELLPASGLALSVLVTVLAGTLVLFYLTEAFGWAFGGLVVPGYLASVLVVSPAAGITVITEAVLTLGVVVVLSDVVARTGLWSNFFGRERFLLLVVVSVLVRQASEIWLWPSLLAYQEPWLGFSLIQAGEAHSIGLVLVPLTANAMGRGSFRNGIAQLAVPTFLAWLLLRTVLLTGTNLSLSAMALTYEDASLDFLQSARAYFILVTGAFVATRFNGAFAWSAGGILIPALLGLAWYEPGRVFATFGEAILVAMVFQGISRLPVVRHWNLEGARKLAILFVLTAAFRLGLAWAHQEGLPIQPNEMSGLGYLLSALIALKILQFGSVPKVVLPALGTSVLAFVGGSTAAWALEQVFPSEQVDAQHDPEPPPSRLLATPDGVIEYARIRTRLDPERSPSVHLPAARLSRWRSFWRLTDASLENPDLTASQPAGSWFHMQVGEGLFGDRRWLVVRENSEQLDTVEGWGTAILRAGASGPALVVSQPWSDAATARNALHQCVELDCAILYLSGMELPTGSDDARAAFMAALGRPVQMATPATIPVSPAEPTAGEVGEFVETAMKAAPGTWNASAAELEFLSSTLVPALAGWSKETVGIGEVRALAATVGLETSSIRCGNSACLGLKPTDTGPILVVRSAGTAYLVTVSHPAREVGTLRLALGAFDSLQATVLLLDPAVATTPLTPVRDPLQALHLGWRRALATQEGAMALWFRGLGAPTPLVPRPSESVVVGAGQPLFGDPPPVLASLQQQGKLAGIWSMRWAGAGVDEPGLAGNHLAGPQADRALGGMTPAVLWFSESARQEWRSDAREVIADWVGAAGLTLEDRDATGPIPDQPRVSTSSSRFAQLADLCRRAAHQHNLNLLRKLVEAQDGHTTVRAAWDPSRLLGWLEVEVREGGTPSQERAWMVPGDGREVTLPVSASTADIRAEMGWMPADLRFEPGVQP